MILKTQLSTCIRSMTCFQHAWRTANRERPTHQDAAAAFHHHRNRRNTSTVPRNASSLNTARAALHSPRPIQLRPLPHCGCTSASTPSRGGGCKSAWKCGLKFDKLRASCRSTCSIRGGCLMSRGEGGTPCPRCCYRLIHIVILVSKQVL